MLEGVAVRSRLGLLQRLISKSALLVQLIRMYMFVADVVKPFDTVDRGILDRVLMTAWLILTRVFRVSCSCYAAGLGQPWTRDGGILQGCPFSMVFTVVLYVRWCRYLDGLLGIRRWLYADNLNGVSSDPAQLLRAARFEPPQVLPNPSHPGSLL